MKIKLTAKQKKQGWRIVKFGDVAQECKEKVDRENNPFERYIAGGDMDSESLRLRRWGIFGEDYVGPAFHRIFRKGQILYGSRRTYLKKVAVADFDGVTANTTFVIEAKPNSPMLSGLLPFLMLSESFTNHSVNNSKGSTNPYILWSDIVGFEFPIPPRERQEEMLKIFKKIETTRLLNERTIPSLDKVASVITEQIFDKSVKTCSFREIAEVFASSVNKKSVKREVPVKLCNYMDVYSNCNIYESMNFMKATAPKKEIARFKLYKNDVVITKDSEDPKDIAIPAYIAEDISDLICGYHLVIIRPDSQKISGRYLFHILNSRWARHAFIPFTQGTTRYGIVSYAYDKIKIPFLNMDQQVKFADTLDLLNEQRSSIIKKDLLYSKIQNKIINKELSGDIV